MVVVLGFGFVHGGERDVEKERGGGGEEERQQFERGEILFWVIYFTL